MTTNWRQVLPFCVLPIPQVIAKYLVKLKKCSIDPSIRWLLLGNYAWGNSYISYFNQSGSICLFLIFSEFL